MTPFETRAASERDLMRILEWPEGAQTRSRTGFYGKKQELERAQAAGALWGLFENADPLAFLAWGLRKDGFLEVRPDRRRQGLGRALVQHHIDALTADGDCCLLDITCEPAESIPFWRKLDFTLYGGSSAFRRLPRSLDLPPGAEAVEVRITSFPDFVLRTGEMIEPLEEFRPAAALLLDGNIQLAERVIFFAGFLNRRYDLVVKIEAGERVLLFDRVASDAAYAVGVREDRYWNHYLDRIQDPPLNDIPSRR